MGWEINKQQSIQYTLLKRIPSTSEKISSVLLSEHCHQKNWIVAEFLKQKNIKKDIHLVTKETFTSHQRNTKTIQ